MHPGLVHLLATGTPADNALVNPRQVNPLHSDRVAAWVRERARCELRAPG